MQLAYRQTGSMLKAARVIAFLDCWEASTDELGRPPTMEEYAEAWNVSEATAYRHKAEFREVFTKCSDPTEVLEFLAAHDLNTRGRRIKTADLGGLGILAA
jgi:hypothetical protein